MEKRALFCIGFVLLLLFAASGAKAEIAISQPNSAYNLGDTINTDFKISYGQDANIYFKAVLSCRNDTLMYFSPIEVEKNREKTISVNWPVSQALGLCKISAHLDGDSASSEHLMTEESGQFELSDKININASINKELFRPLEELEIDGDAMFDNSNTFDGTIVIKIDGEEHLVQASKGAFSYSAKIDSEIIPGMHSITISAKDGSGNSGDISLSFEAEGIPTALEINIDNESIMPGGMIMITPKILDQANGIMNKSIYLKISNPKDSFFGKETILLEEIAGSGNSTEYKFDKYAKPGNYNIDAEFEDFKTTENVEIQVYEKINFSLSSDTLYVENIGNVPYERPVEIKFMIENQTSTKVIELSLGVGENKTYLLRAPKGTYDIEISAGNETLKSPATALTGDAITVLQLGAGEPMDYTPIIFLAFIILVAIILAIFLSRKNRRGYKTGKKGKTVSASSFNMRMKPIDIPRIDVAPKSGSFLKTAFAKHSSKLAADSLIPSVVYGTKQEITVLNILLEGSREHAEGFLAQAIDKIKMHQGVADIYGNSLIVMFNVVKQQRHDMAAVKTAQEIANLGKKMNFRTRAGINTGLATVSAIGADKSVSYTELGKSASIAKALAAKAQANGILISEEVHKRAGDAIIVKKVSPYNIGGNKAIEVYALSEGPASEKKDDMQWFIDRAIGKTR